LRIEEYIPLRLSELCKKHGYTKYRLAQLTGMSQTALGKILSQTSVPTVTTLEKMCDAFGISLAQFFAEEGVHPDLTQEEKEILEVWSSLDRREKEILISFIRTLKK
jgi:transcriptional regulator with XRE-family HTH domain